MKKLIIPILMLLFFAGTSFAQLKLNAEVNGGMASPQGDLGDFYKTGYNFNAAVFYGISDNFDVSLSVGYLRFGFDNDKLNNSIHEIDPTAPTFSGDAYLSSVPVMVGVKYYLITGMVKPYLTADLGMHFLTVTSPSGNYVVGSDQTITASSASESKSGFGIGAGILFSITPSLSVDVAAKYNTISFEAKQESTTVSGNTTTTTSSSSTASYFTIMAGLNFPL